MRWESHLSTQLACDAQGKEMNFWHDKITQLFRLVPVNGFGERIERMAVNGFGERIERMAVNGFGERIERMAVDGLGS